MHTAGKVLLIIGGVITVLGIVLIVGGAATANLDPSKENYYSGNGGDTWTVPGDDFYAVYTSSSVNCESFEMTITDPEYPEDNLLHCHLVTTTTKTILLMMISSKLAILIG